jgi:hypothetical protein
VSHLADCESCRGVVVGLAGGAGAGAEVKHQAVAAAVPAVSERTPAWRALLASLFAPRVLRFAVPVLALSLVGVVSYVALRSNNRGPSQAARDARPQVGTLQSESGVPAAASNNDSASSNAELLDAKNSNAASHEAAVTGAQPSDAKGHGAADAPRPADAEAVRKDVEESASAPPPPPPAAAAPTEGPAELSKSAPRPVTTEEGETARGDSKEKSESRDKSARQSEPGDDLAANDAAAQRNRAAQSRMNQVQMPDGGARNDKRAADNNAAGGSGGGNAAAAPPKDSERAGSRSDAASRARVARRAEKKAEEGDEDRADETRTAAGHRFRREGNAWVDVNYKSSMPSTGVHRGTDAFRALVADVPEVGRVAEAVGGEVTVVVGGRAYRIR